MKHFDIIQHRAWRQALALSGAIAMAAGYGFSLSSPASAQAAYGSYVGVGGSFGLSDGGPAEDSASGVTVALRYRLLNAPISLRAQALISDATAIVPTVSYDFPLSWYTDAYIGAGVAIQDADTDASPIGNQAAFVIQPGIDHNIPRSRWVLFGNAIIAFDAYRQSGDAGVAIQGGAGLRF